MRFRRNQSIISIKMIIFGSLFITFEKGFNQRYDYLQVFSTIFKLIGVYWSSWDSKEFRPRLKRNHTTKLIKRVKIVDIHGIFHTQSQAPIKFVSKGLTATKQDFMWQGG